MKKWIAVLCAVTLVISATGCEQSEEETVKNILNEKLSGEITVSCYDTMSYKDALEKAAKAFEKKNPGTKINIECFAPMPEQKEMEDGGATIVTMTAGDDEQQRTDYISKINTELMSGKGSDILAMDVLPYYKYADGGQLENLQNYMDADSSFDIKDYRKNILDAMEYKGGQYILPLDYMFYYLTYDTSLFDENEKQSLQNNSKFTYNQLIEAGKIPFQRVNKNSDGQIKMFDEFADAGMLRELLSADYEKFIDVKNRKVNLTDGSFVKLLKSVKKYGEDGYLKLDSGSNEFSMEDYKKMTQAKYIYRTKGNFFLLDEAFKRVGIDPENSFDVMAGDESNDKLLGLLTNKEGNINFKYTQAYGINSNSENKGLAWAFIKFLIDGNTQSFSIGLPINNEACLEKCKSDILGLSLGENTMDQQGKELTEEQKKVYETYKKLIEKYSASLNCCPIKDDTIDTMIEKEVSYYFDGSKTANEVANILQKKIELYLNE
ncbi:ABC transporter substrate-binding protein [Anaerovorax odorimutans]|uniref:ABC transporter substrate-binding protein n=1 Tax=Anaerovorax odorimutans TaxID=109327 RepID=UPI0004197785|nr:extracellular solute-binding protein [Anaerovorax odorimutans]